MISYHGKIQLYRKLQMSSSSLIIKKARAPNLTKGLTLSTLNDTANKLPARHLILINAALFLYGPTENRNPFTYFTFELIQ